MPGHPMYLMSPGSATEGGSPAAAGGMSSAANGSHFGFVFWLVVIGVVVPIAIIGGLQVGGFSFVFRHR